MQCCAVVILARFFAGHQLWTFQTHCRHAQECRRMATSTRDAADKATWSQMAKRWLACAEYHEDEQSALGTRAESRHRKIHVGLRLPLASSVQ